MCVFNRFPFAEVCKVDFFQGYGQTYLCAGKVWTTEKGRMTLNTYSIITLWTEVKTTEIFNLLIEDEKIELHCYCPDRIGVGSLPEK